MNNAALLIKGIRVMKSLTDAKQLAAADRYFKLVRQRVFGRYHGFALTHSAYQRSDLYSGFCEMRDVYLERGKALTGVRLGGTDNCEGLVK